MKRILAAITILFTLAVSLTGCMGDVEDVTVMVKNATEYEIKWVVFDIPQSSGSYSPMHDIITTESASLEPDEKREVTVSVADTDFGNSGGALIGLKDDGSSSSLEVAKGEVVLERGTNLFTITHDGESFVITAGDANVETSTKTDAETQETGFTLFADFSAGSADAKPRLKKIPLPPQEDMPSSNALIAFFLADSLSEWTGLDFTLNDVTFGEDSITVDWSADSTLIRGLDNREQKEDFHFFDAVSLNWFMMDSLAQTLKHNLPVTTVYYASNGAPIPFQNPEDMAAQGLPLLPVDQPYEGSAFFVTHADGNGGETGDLAYWNGFNFGPNLGYNEEYENRSDPGEYVNAAEAAKRTFDALKSGTHIPQYSDDTEYTLVLVNMDDIEGEPCYIYRLDDIQFGCAYAYQSGNVYYEKSDGAWVRTE